MIPSSQTILNYLEKCAIGAPSLIPQSTIPRPAWYHFIDRGAWDAVEATRLNGNNIAGQMLQTDAGKENLMKQVLPTADYDRVNKMRGTADQVGQFTNEQGQFDSGKVMNHVGGWFNQHVAGPLQQGFGQLTSGNTQGALETAKQNPWLTGGVAALGGVGLYGAAKAATGLLSSPTPHFSQPTPRYQSHPSLEKASGLFGMSLSSNIMSTFDSPQNEPTTKPVHQYNISGGSPQAKKLLTDPRMRSYLSNLITNMDKSTE